MALSPPEPAKSFIGMLQENVECGRRQPLPNRDPLMLYDRLNDRDGGSEYLEKIYGLAWPVWRSDRRFAES